MSKQTNLEKPLEEAKEGVYRIEDVEMRRSSNPNLVEIVGDDIKPFWASLKADTQIQEGSVSIRVMKSGSYVKILDVKSLDKRSVPFTQVGERRISIGSTIIETSTSPDCSKGTAILIGDKLDRMRCP